MTSDMIVKNMGHFLSHLDPMYKKQEDLNVYTWKT